MSTTAFIQPAYRASRDAVLLIVLLALSFLAAGCSDDGTAPTPSPVVASVVVTPAQHAMFVGETRAYSARLLDADGREIEGRAVTWSSSDEAVATISATGTVTALRSGTAFIKGSVGTTFGSGALAVTDAPVAAVTLDRTALSLAEGESTNLVATVKDAAGRTLPGRTIAWSSDNASVATVSASGTVTAMNAGNTVIRATSEGKEASATVAITAATVDRVEISHPTITLAEGTTHALTAVAKDAAGRPLGGRAIEWETSDERIVTVSVTGAITAVTEGMANVIARVDGKQAISVVTVTRAPVASVAISPSPTVIEVGEERQLTAIVRDAAGRLLQGRTVQWSVDVDNAEVSNTGLLLGRRNGYVTIRATSEGVVGAIGGTVVDVTPSDYDLLYTRQGGNNVQEIFTLTIGSGTIPVKVNAGSVSRSPTATPDGLRIAFAVSMTDPLGTRVDDIFAVDRNGMNMKRLTTDPGYDAFPAYSPNGQRIAYIHSDVDLLRTDVWIMNADGTQQVNLTGDVAAGSTFSSPAWAHDGSRIAFFETKSGGAGTTTTLWTMRPDGSDKRSLTSTTTGFDQSPTWSPDGRKIAFMRYYAGTPDITIVDVATGLLTRIQRPGFQWTPSWSPDGLYIAFAEPFGPQSRLYTMQPDGSKVRLRTLDPAWGGGLSPQWIRKQ